MFSGDIVSLGDVTFPFIGATYYPCGYCSKYFSSKSMLIHLKYCGFLRDADHHSRLMMNVSPTSEMPSLDIPPTTDLELAFLHGGVNVSFTEHDISFVISFRFIIVFI